MNFINKYIKAVENYYGDSILLSAGNKRNNWVNLEPTRLFILLLNKEEGYSAGEIHTIANFTKDRSTIYNDLKQAQEAYESNKFFKKRYNEILQTIPKTIIE